jgi:Fe-Mn family superoxide dismutase
MFELPNLPYDYNALEPHIDEETMHVHHDKHHQAYLDKLNKALEEHPELFEKSIEEILMDLNSIPDDIRTAVTNNGGGYFHHSILWEMMSPNGGDEPSGELADAINQAFGSFEKFKEDFTQKASTQFASGWTWLTKDSNGKLAITQTPNQDSPISAGLTPLIGIDIWEHAYYLKYQNRRPEYVEAWWNVVNWEYTENKFNT